MKKVKSLKDYKGNKILRQRYLNKGNTLNLVIESKAPINKFDNLFVYKNLLSCRKLFKLISRDKGTGYHIKEGIFISNSNIRKKIIQDIKIILFGYM